MGCTIIWTVASFSGGAPLFGARTAQGPALPFGALLLGGLIFFGDAWPAVPAPCGTACASHGTAWHRGPGILV